MRIGDILHIKNLILEYKKNNSNIHLNTKSKDILFVIPGPESPGSGGHNTLAMFINFLSKKLKDNIYIFYYRCAFETTKEQHQLFINGYDTCNKVKSIEKDELNRFKFKYIIFTDHYSWFLQDVITGDKKFVFLQDWEHLFDAAGWVSVFAEYNLRRFDIYICASKWLEDQVKKFVKEARDKKIYSFELGIESELNNLFSLKRKNNKKKKISAYVRTSTPRRCWEIVREAYKELIIYESSNFEMSLFGMDCSDLIRESNFEVHVKNDGLLPKKKLPEYFLQHDLILAFSATNYNLILWDSISVGTPVMDLDIKATEHIIHPLIIKTSPYPEDICSNIVKNIYLDHQKPSKQFVKSLQWDSRISKLWEGLKIEFI